jgi:hypothetical protein
MQITNFTYYEKAKGISGNSLGQISSSYFIDTANKIIADQQARVGRFLTYKQKLYELKFRTESIQKFEYQSGSILLSRTNSLISMQNTLEKQGLDLLINVDRIQKNPLVLAITGNTEFYKYSSEETTQRINTLFSDLKNMWNLSITLNSNLSTHESNINKLEKDILSKEKELSGQGFVPQVTKALSQPVEMFKWIAIIGVVGLGAYILFMRK